MRSEVGSLGIGATSAHSQAAVRSCSWWLDSFRCSSWNHQKSIPISGLNRAWPRKHRRHNEHLVGSLSRVVHTDKPDTDLKTLCKDLFRSAWNYLCELEFVSVLLHSLGECTQNSSIGSICDSSVSLSWPYCFACYLQLYLIISWPFLAIPVPLVFLKIALSKFHVWSTRRNSIVIW